MRILEQIDHDTLTAYTALPSPQVLTLLALLRTHAHTQTHTACTALPSPQVLTLLALLRARTHTLSLCLSICLHGAPKPTGTHFTYFTSTNDKY
jgi:hypothetical protein